MAEGAKFALEDFVAPLSAGDFLAQHWSSGRPLLSAPRLDVVEKLKAIESLASADALLAVHKKDISLFGPNSFRSSVPARVAGDFLHAGYNLYITGVEETVPQARALFLDIARSLGVFPTQISLEAFAGNPGGISSRHYDHDINFQILMEGEKDWELEGNTSIENPMFAYHPTRDREGQWRGFVEEAYATHPAVPTEFDPERVEKMRAAPGTVLFLPRGYWHQTRSITKTWGVNLVIKGFTWAMALSQALQNALHRAPVFRSYCEGIAYGGGESSATDPARQGGLFDALKAEAARALHELTLEEVVLAGGIHNPYRWNPKASTRKLVSKDGRWLLEVEGVLKEPLEMESEILVEVVRKLCAFQQPFAWAHVRAAIGEIGADELYNLLTDFVSHELLIRD